MAGIPSEVQGWDLGGGVIMLSPWGLPSTVCNYSSASEPGQTGFSDFFFFFYVLGVNSD